MTENNVPILDVLKCAPLLGDMRELKGGTSKQLVPDCCKDHAPCLNQHLSQI